MTQYYYFHLLLENYHFHFFSDLEVNTFTTVPDANAPLVGPLGKTGVTFTADVRNRATAGPGAAIAAVTGANKNFLISAFYSASSSSPVAIGSTFTPAVSTSQLQSGLVAVGTSGALTTFTGTIDYPATATVTCSNIQFVCVEFEPDTANGAIWSEGASTLANNVKCLAISLTCAPGEFFLLTSGFLLSCTVNFLSIEFSSFVSVLFTFVSQIMSRMYRIFFSVAQRVSSRACDDFCSFVLQTPDHNP